jgi:cytochrome c oxidase cbb3-type subunit 1
MNNNASVSRDPINVLDGLAVLFALAGLAAGIALVVLSPEYVMKFHGAVLAIGCALFFLLLGKFGKETTAFNDNVIKAGVIALMFWGIAGFIVGDYIAWELAFPALNLDLPWTNFGRLRPLHTSAVIFAFGGNALIFTSFYALQRTCQARLSGRYAPWFVFIGFNTLIVMAGTGYLLGVTHGREYAEPEWYSDLWLTLVWVMYLLIYLGTLWRRKEPHIYVANWFYLAFIITIAILHLGNNPAVPVDFLRSHSYVFYSGVQDAMTQWWYGHNAVGFFLTAGFLGMMYYFVPKRAERPVYSYRLSIVHFWALIFTYMWAGPHHLHWTSLPDWAQTLGMTLSIILWMPSWGGMINGLMTLSGAWDKLRTDPVIRFLVVSVAFYGMSTFEGPLMSIKAVNSLSHYTDWTVGHVHSGALGWVAMVTFGSVYCLVPWLWKRKELYSRALVEWHFWICTLGILLYITSMWVSGIMQGLMWRVYDEFGALKYYFVETVEAMHPYYVIRATGGVLFLIGALIMAYNLWMTVAAQPAEADARMGVSPAPAE